MARLRLPFLGRSRGPGWSLSNLVLAGAVIVGLGSLAAREWNELAREASENRQLYAQRLVDKFEQVVFHPEAFEPRGLDAVRKWTGPIRIRLLGDAAARYRSLVARQADALGRLAGLGIALVERADEDPNLTVHLIAGDDALDALAQGYRVGADALRRAIETEVCVLLLDARPEGPIARAAIVVDMGEVGTRYSESQIRACLVEELTQSLGLPGRSALLPPSVFDPGEEHLQGLSPSDRILVATLYDASIRAGMTRHEALAQARSVIARRVGANAD